MNLLHLALLAASVRVCSGSVKRGLIYIPNEAWPQDDSVWIQDGSTLTWYYTYGDQPNPRYRSPQSALEFVPMMWGMGGNPDDTSFRDSIIKQLEAGADIRYVLSFNEPDMRSDWGGSNIEPAKAARGYIANMLPLKERGIKIGLPAVSGASWGIQWLREFAGNCTEVLNEECQYDFLPVHWYDNFGGLKAHIDEATHEFPDAKIWVTEYAFAHQTLETTKGFYYESAAYLESSEIVERYSYFGAFRSQVSNVGANATFLNRAGQLTEIGLRYLGLEGNGVEPTSG